MTRLKLCKGYLVDQDISPQGLSALRTLELEGIQIDALWLQKFSSLLSGLTSLELNDSSVVFAAPAPPIASLRWVLEF